MSFTRLTQALLLFLIGIATAQSSRAQTYSVLYSFTGGTDGAIPLGGLTRDSAGNLYGTTASGATEQQKGTVFKLSKTGHFTLLHSFGTGGAGGANPYAGVIRDSAGNLYGTTLNGGLNYGTIFKLDKKNNFTVLYTFSGGTDGQGPDAPLVLDPAGNLYGTTPMGGSAKCDGGAGCGVAFKLDPQGNETVLRTFLWGKRGTFPSAGLLRDAAGNLYGTTIEGGQQYRGVVFKIDPAGNETVLHSFQPQPDGQNPWSALVRDSAGNLYGTTVAGGNKKCSGRGCGIVFKLDPNGIETVLYTFTGGKSDGASPNGPLVFDSAGNLYGTTFDGGTQGPVCADQGCGVVFKLDPSGKETVLYSFSGGTDGAFPFAGLVIDSAGNLYGTAAHGGNLNDCPQSGGGCGVIFKIAP